MLGAHLGAAPPWCTWVPKCGVLLSSCGLWSLCFRVLGAHLGAAPPYRTWVPKCSVLRSSCGSEFPTGDAWVVFGGKKVWATRWNGGRGGVGLFRGDGIDSPPKFLTGDAWVVFGDNKLWATCWNGCWGCKPQLLDAKVHGRTNHVLKIDQCLINAVLLFDA